MSQAHNENHGKKLAHYFFIFRRFWVKEPRHSETAFHTKSAPSIVARALNDACYATAGDQGCGVGGRVYLVLSLCVGLILR